MSRNFRSSKKAKKEHLSPITLGYIYTRPKTKCKMKHIKRMKVLFDSGASATLIQGELVKKLKKEKTEKVKWHTKTGTFETDAICPIQFMLPAFHTKKEIEWRAFVENSPSGIHKYDLIIGQDLMEELQIDLKFSDMTITWDNATIPMRDVELISTENIELFAMQLFYLHDPGSTEAERIQQILDHKYTPADLKAVANSCNNLTKEQQDKLYKLLSKFPDVFDGSLGTWDTDPVELELKNPDEKPYHAKPYPVPHSQETKLKQEVERLVGEGII
jgi:hypothetical protein